MTFTNIKLFVLFFCTIVIFCFPSLKVQWMFYRHTFWYAQNPRPSSALGWSTPIDSWLSILAYCSFFSYIYSFCWWLTFSNTSPPGAHESFIRCVHRTFLRTARSCVCIETSRRLWVFCIDGGSRSSHSVQGAHSTIHDSVLHILTILDSCNSWA